MTDMNRCDRNIEKSPIIINTTPVWQGPGQDTQLSAEVQRVATGVIDLGGTMACRGWYTVSPFDAVIIL